MNGGRRILMGYVVAVILFLACVALMLVLAHSEPPTLGQRQPPQDVGAPL